MSTIKAILIEDIKLVAGSDDLPCDLAEHGFRPCTA